MNGKQFQTKDNTTIQRVSRWIKLRRVAVTKRHSLAEYADFTGTDNPNEGTLTYFIHNGKNMLMVSLAVCPIRLSLRMKMVRQVI